MITYIVMVLLGVALIYWAVKKLKKKTKIAVIVFGAFIALGGLFYIIDPSAAKQSEQQQAQAQKESSESVEKASSQKASSKKAASESKAKSSTASSSTKIVADSNATVKMAIKEYAPSVKVKTVAGSYMGQDDTTQVTIKGKEGVTDKLTTKGMYMDISSVWKALKKTDLTHLKNVGVAVEYPLQDDAGNSTKTLVIKTYISPAKLGELNAKNFDYDNVPTFATSFWQHDALPEIN